MQVLNIPVNFDGLIFDMDGTLYQCPAYLKDGDRNAVVEVGKQLGWENIEIESKFEAQRKIIEERNGRKATMSETVFSLHLTSEWWNRIRSGCYHPENFLRPNRAVVESIIALLDRYQVAVVSNSPKALIIRVLRTLGFDRILDRIKVLGPEDTGVAKPDPNYYPTVAKLMGLTLQKCLSIGDRIDADGLPALNCGMGAVIIEDLDDLIWLCGLLRHRQGPFYARDFLQEIYRSGEIVVYGITGQAGVGKTSISRQCRQLGEVADIPVEVLPLDAFFKLSSRQRRAWLEEGKKISEAEHSRRADQMTWWDFDRLEEVIETLKSGRPIYMTNVYNREDRGELTGTVNINPNPRGMVILVEGVAIAHMRTRGLQHLTALHAPANIRLRRLQSRDPHREGDEMMERFAITESFERSYFGKYLNLADLHIDSTDKTLYKLAGPPLVEISYNYYIASS